MHICSSCGKRYTHLATLRQHVRNVCGREPRHCCQLCTYKTPVRGTLLRHLRSVHKQDIPPERFTSNSSKYAIKWYIQNTWFYFCLFRLIHLLKLRDTAIAFQPSLGSVWSLTLPFNIFAHSHKNKKLFHKVWRDFPSNWCLVTHLQVITDRIQQNEVNRTDRIAGRIVLSV